MDAIFILNTHEVRVEWHVHNVTKHDDRYTGYAATRLSCVRRDGWPYASDLTDYLEKMGVAEDVSFIKKYVEKIYWIEG